MASILDKYGIKEVADVVFYELDSKGAPSAPVLYLDTLKVSTIEQSAEVVDATGGKGNVKLISWDTNKEVTATFEDALFSVKSLAIMFGGQVTDNEGAQEVLKTVNANLLKVEKGSGSSESMFWKIPVGNYEMFLEPGKGTYFKYDGSEIVSAGTALTDNSLFDFMTFDILDCTNNAAARDDNNGKLASGLEIKIDASTFGGTYYITGDTYARNYQSGKDEFLQFIIPKGKVSAEDLALTMEADGDPATFSMNINVLRTDDGTMFKLVKYTLNENTGDSAVLNKGVASVLGKYNTAGTENQGYGTNASQATGSRPTTPNASGSDNTPGK